MSNTKDDAPKRTQRDDKEGYYAVVGRSVLVNRPRAELYAFWRDFQNLPQFMEAIESIQPATTRRMTWTVKALAGQTVELEAGLTSEVEGRSLGRTSTESPQRWDPPCHLYSDLRVRPASV